MHFGNNSGILKFHIYRQGGLKPVGAPGTMRLGALQGFVKLCRGSWAHLSNH